MGVFIAKSIHHLSFSGSGTQTISIDSNHAGLVTFLDLSAAATRSGDITVGSNQVWKGWFSTTPVQLRFGLGRGSGEAGDDVSVTVDGACEIFLGLRQIEVSQ